LRVGAAWCWVDSQRPLCGKFDRQIALRPVFAVPKGAKDGGSNNAVANGFLGNIMLPATMMLAIGGARGKLVHDH